MTYDIFIKTYQADEEWLKYCLRSLQKFVTGFRRIIVAMPPDMELPLTIEHIVRLPGPESYMYQQVAKLHADCHTDADFILHIDSDCVLTRPVSPETFMYHGKPEWLMRPMDDPQAIQYRAWFQVMAKCLKQDPRYEYMCKNTILIPRQAYGLFRDFVQETHGLPLSEYVLTQPRREFSEYNCLGMYLHTHHPELCYFRDITKEGLPVDWIKQYWSYAGITPENHAEIQEILR